VYYIERKKVETLVIAVVSALFGGVGVKIVEYYTTRKKTEIEGNAQVEIKEIDDAILYRQELREDIDRLKKELKDVHSSMDAQRTEYFVLQRKYDKLEYDYSSLKREHESLKEEHDLLKKQVESK
jgi:predicted nuclease with TOPRIM domain